MELLPTATRLKRLAKAITAGLTTVVRRRGMQAGMFGIELEPLEPRTLLSGVTLITHGYEAWSSNRPPWLDTMASAIAERSAGNATVYAIRITDNDSTTMTRLSGPDPFAQSNPSAEVVVLLDWADASGLGIVSSYHSTSEIAGLVTPYFNTTFPSIGLTHPLAELPIHLIGHSRGASVVSTLASDLGMGGVWVDQLTTLDPHPVFPDAAVSVTDNVWFADNYYQTAGIISPNGAPILGSHNLNLTNLSGIGHSGVHTYYDGTIDLSATTDGDSGTILSSWYDSAPTGPRDAVGFDWSLIGGGDRPSDGLPNGWLGGTGPRQQSTLTALGHDVWDNIQISTPWSDLTVKRGDPIEVKTLFSDLNHDAILSVGLDTDTNPYDFVAANSTVSIDTTSINGSTWTPVLATAEISLGTYHVYARVSNGIHTRYYYSPAVVTITNQPPTNLTLSSGSIPENQSIGAVVGTFSTADPNVGDSFAYALVNGTGSTDNASFTINGNTLKTAASLNSEAKNSYSIRVRTTDAGGLFFEKSFTVNITNINDSPAGTDGTVTTLEDEAYTLTPANFGFTDPNDNPPNSLLGVKIATLPALGTLTDNATAVMVDQTIPLADISGGKLVFTPAANANGLPYTTFTFQVQDNGGKANGGVDLDPTTNTLTFNVTAVNDPPSGTDKTVTTLEGAAYNFAVADFGFTDPNDTPANVLSAVKITTLPTAGSLTNNGVAVTTGQAIPIADISGGKLVFTPAANANGTSYTTFTFQVQDNGGTVNGGVDLDPTPNTITVSVTLVNDAPSFTKGSDQIVNEDDGPQAVAGWAAAISAGPADESNQALNFVVGNNNPSLFSIQPAVTADGTLTYTPAPNANGVATVTVTLHDNGGTGNGGVDISAPQTFSITIQPINDPPSFAAYDPSPALIDSGPRMIPQWASFSPGPANELNQGVISYAVSNISNPALFADPPVVANDGTLTYTPAAGATGTSTFRVTVQDNGGTDLGGIDTSSPRDFTINVDYRWLHPDSKNRINYTDANGIPVRVSLTGPGTFAFAFKTYGAANPTQIKLTGTTTKSSLTISTPQGTQTAVGDILVGTGDVPAALKNFIAGSTNLGGNFIAIQAVGAITLGNVADDHMIHVGSSVDPKATLTIKLGRVANTRLVSGLPIKSLTAIEWLGDGSPDSITTPWLGVLKITGSKMAGSLSAGDFMADVLLSDATQKKTLGTVSIAGTADGAHFISGGNIGSFTVGAMRNSTLAAGFTGAVTELPLGLPTAFNTLAAITSVTVKDLPGNNNGFVNSLIYGATLGMITLKDVQTSNPGDTLGVAAHTLKSYVRKDAAGKVVKKLAKLVATIADADNDTPDDLVVTLV